ncbi:MAG: hypothetical protein AAF678_03090 [Pseudomonadota bacterium]
MTPKDFETRSALLQEGLRAKIGVHSSSLPQALRRANRLLPKRSRTAGLVLIDAERKLAHPKIARQVDAASVDQAFGEIEKHLQGIDPKERRKDARLRWLAMFILNMAVVALLVVALLRWQGLV